MRVAMGGYDRQKWAVRLLACLVRMVISFAILATFCFCLVLLEVECTDLLCGQWIMPNEVIYPANSAFLRKMVNEA